MSFQGILKYLLIFGVSLVTALAATPVAMRLALRLGMMDLPDARRVHTRPTPRGGGLAVVLAFHAACAAIFLLPWRTFSGGLTIDWWYRMLPLSAGLTLVGFLDDYRGLRPWVKLAGQVAVAVAAWSMKFRIGGFFGAHPPQWLDLALTVFWFVALMNAFNLIDGMDGVAAGLGTIASAGLVGSFFVRSLPSDCLVSLALMGACLGFLHYNFHPARVFLGDTGSMFIGFALAAISLSTYTKGTTFTALLVPALVVGVPLFDTFLAVWRRTARKILGHTDPQLRSAGGGRVFGADKDHLHHRLHATGRSQQRVAVLLYLAAMGLAGVGLLGMIFHNLAGGIYVVAFVAAVYVVVRHVAYVEIWDSASALVYGLSRPISRNVVVPAYIVADIAILFFSQTLAHLLVRDGWSDPNFRTHILEEATILVGLPFVALAAAGMYRRIWSRARIMDFVFLTAALGGGLAVGFGIAMMTRSGSMRFQFVEIATVFFVALALMSCLRLFRRVLADLRGSVVGWGAQSSQALTRALIYGAGHTGLLFLHKESGAAPGSADCYRIFGFLDDDTNLHGRIMHGHPVLGGSESLATIFPSTAAEIVIVTAKLRPEPRRRLFAAAAACGVRVFQWKTELEEIGDPLSGLRPAEKSDMHLPA